MLQVCILTHIHKYTHIIYIHVQVFGCTHAHTLMCKWLKFGKTKESILDKTI